MSFGKLPRVGCNMSIKLHYLKSQTHFQIIWVMSVKSKASVFTRTSKLRRIVIKDGGHTH